MSDYTPFSLIELQRQHAELPNRAYKYRPLQDPSCRRPKLHVFTKRSIYNRELYFASPAELNDLFDCNIDVAWEDVPESQMRTRLKEAALRKEGIDDEEREALVEHDIQLFLPNSKAYAKHLQNDFSIAIEKGISVLSLTTNQLHPLMWAHYASAHTGICLGFDGKKMLEWLRDTQGLATSTRPLKVTYVPQMKTLSPGTHTAGALMMEVLTNKHEDWKYEKEIRLVCLNRGSHSIIAPSGILDEVIFGARSNKKLIEVIINDLRDSGVSFKQACRKRSGYGIELVSL